MRFRTWKQGDLNLSYVDSPSYPVRLEVDGAPGEEVKRLCWIHADSLDGNSDTALKIESFEVDWINESTYAVMIPPGILSKRLRAINRAQKNANEGKVDIDPRLLLPFVEML